MKIIYKTLCILLLIGTISAQEKRKEPEEQEQGQAKRPRMQEVPVSERSAFEQIPADVKNIILNLLVTAEGTTNIDKLQAAARNIRNFMTLNKSFKARYLDNEAVNGYLIQQLAQRYTHGDLVGAALALHTPAGGRWLSQQIAEGRGRWNNLAVELLYNAARVGDLGTLSFLLNVVSDRDNRSKTAALIFAAENGHTAIVEKLLAVLGIEALHYGALFKALMLAAQNGHTAIVKRLLEVPYYINVNFRGFGKTALESALESTSPNKEIIIKLLRDHGAVE